MNKVEKYLVEKGFDLNKLLKDTTDYRVTNMDKAAVEIKKAISEGKHIFVVADYDVDGVMSGMNLATILTHMGANFTMRFPRRKSEGYGIAVKMVDEAPDGALIITIDNGIAAIEAIEYAKEKGHRVVILDHHEKRDDGLIPNADVVVNPHIFREEGEFEHYCGAGLAYMLARELDMPVEIIRQVKTYAAFATVQDVVPLVDNNRNIVKDGLILLNAQVVPMDGIYSLCSALKLMPNRDKKLGINEEDISFQIGPCINSMGRMYDDGAQKTFEYLMHYKKHGEDGIAAIVECNKFRKEKTVEQQNRIEIEAQSILAKNKKTTCMVVYLPELEEGIIGINAAKVVEQYNMPAIVFTNSEDPEIYKGSARSVDDVNVKEQLDKVAELIYKYGGHKGAAGLSVEKKNFDAFVAALNAVVPKSAMRKNTWEYDLEIEESEIPDMYEALRKYAPFGEACRAPIFKVNNFHLAKNFGKYYRLIGDNGISLNGQNTEAVSFTLKDKYSKLGHPLNLNIVGNIGYSRFSKKPNIMLNDFQSLIEKQDTGFLI